MAALRVVELYSGVGGMHYALKESGIPAQVVAAVDINTTANRIYQHNFPQTTLWNKTIEGISLDDFNKLSFDMLLMSPPCQPFTRIGLQGDVTDARTKSFLYILQLLPRLHRRPRFILLENVKGFETSCARERLVETLKDCGYLFQEIMLSPTSVGIPNSRLRYFLMAKLSTESQSSGFTVQISDVFPQTGSSGQDSVVHSVSPPEASSQEDGVLYKLETVADVHRKSTQNRDQSLRQIGDFLEPQTEVDIQQFRIPPKTLLRYCLLLDVVKPSCRRSVCFTKGYGRYVEGTGSVLQCQLDTEMQSVFTGLELCSEEQKLERLLKLQLRYFTPREVANLMGFPQSFSFPDQVSILQQYRVLGNSLNVVLVSRLLQLLVAEHEGSHVSADLLSTSSSI
ncbi:tRNA (cytosine(38)-C(5))-methyltransferase isoform X2 [Salarias fasciatus]|uniref:tRNA (cytosine(38)-C(5))-methyltransferase n=1 Tax=Salarias fasciatus TaxID=181472 RepID=A0A672HTL6_SALFA|nr:tRNA (cytosine(38)-C(5))-methyltransferase isoform X2 [Salarias fasciatus]